jgi:predicted RNase H-like nuclease (RuvC/YqgF family)
MFEEVKKLDNTVKSYIKYIKNLPKENLDPENWGNREILIHIVFWHKNIEKTLESLNNKEKPIYASGTFRELNEKAINNNKKKSINELVNNLQDSQKRISFLVKNIDDINQYIQFKEEGKQYLVLQAISRIESHIRNHQKKLTKKRCLF